ncbi:MAG: polysaccharide pyruvyl transferase family protein [Flammeovirgaceae bacterium]|nr:polysaccharide pyruvyl transferase family protein [Flammeovirgaceae bacterium]
MNILIVGGNLDNKGAYLMLVTLISELKKRFPNSNICVSPSIRDAELEKLDLKYLDFPLLHIGFDRFAMFLKYGNIIKLLKKKFRGEIKFSEIDIIFDISGYAYSDFWGPSPVHNLLLLLDHCKRKNIKYILMPQAFGPFTNIELVSGMKKVLENVDLIFARDKVSKTHLEQISNQSNKKVDLFPDITLNYSISETNSDEKSDKYCCIVPNERMLDKGKEIWKGNYVKVMTKVVDQILTTSDLRINILVHDTFNGGDGIIASKIKDAFQSDRVEIVAISDAIEIKKFIKKSQFLIGSRYHSIASALSSDVPAIGLGWSHKYQMLFDDYNLSSYIFETPNELEIENLTQKLLNTDHNKVLREQLQLVNKEIHKKFKDMWDIIIDEIN